MKEYIPNITNKLYVSIIGTPEFVVWFILSKHLNWEEIKGRGGFLPEIKFLREFPASSMNMGDATTCS